MARQQPINAEVPPGKKGEAPQPPPKAPKPRRRAPLPPRLVGGAILLVAVFLVAAVIGGGGESGGGNGAGSGTGVGPPVTATKNTSRVDGDGPATNAAGVALAVFPSAEEDLRPPAATLVAESDPAGAIAAAVLASPPSRAPVLLTGEDGPPPVTEEALDALGNPETTVLKAGSSPAATAAAVARIRDRRFGSPPTHLVLASEDQLAFAMPAAAWAARSGDPVLFAAKDELPAPTVRILRTRRKTPVYVLGPSSAISSAVVRRVAALGHPVRRVSGEDPVSNAVAFARYRDGGFGWDVNDPGHGFVVARSDSPLDAGAAAPLSASGTWGPLLLTDDADTLPAALHGYLLDVKPGYTTDPTRAFYNHVWLIGDEKAIGLGEQAEIDNLAELAKIGGKE